MSVGVPLAQVLVASPGKGMQVERIRLASELWAADKKLNVGKGFTRAGAGGVVQQGMQA